MFQDSDIRSAIALILSLGLVTSVCADEGAAAGGGEGQVVEKAKAKSSVESSESVAPSIWGGAMSTTLSSGSSGISAAQQSATAGYELSGSNMGAVPAKGSIATAPAAGSPLRFDNGIYVYPKALIGIAHNTNVVGTKTNEVASVVSLFRPGVVAELKHAGDRYTLSYNGNFGHYMSSKDDDFKHHDLTAAGDNYFTSRFRLGWSAGYVESSDPRGSTNTGATPTPNRWHAPTARVLAIYGAEGSIGRLEAEGSTMQKRYINNRATTEASDVDISMVAGRFYYRFMPKTSALIEARNTWSNYALATSTQDNSLRAYYLGVTWDATAKTTGTVKLGRAYKDFDSNTRQDASIGSWEASVRWSPLTYSSFDLISGKTADDSTGLGNFLINKSTNLIWNHKWASYFSSRVTAGLLKTDFSGVNRKDETKSYGVGVYRELGPRLRVGFDWNRTDRSSSDITSDFKRDVTMLTLEGVL